MLSLLFRRARDPYSFLAGISQQPSWNIGARTLHMSGKKRIKANFENKKWWNEIHYYVMEETLIGTTTKAFLELKHGYCSEDRKD